MFNIINQFQHNVNNGLKKSKGETLFRTLDEKELANADKLKALLEQSLCSANRALENILYCARALDKKVFLCWCLGSI